MPTETEEQQGLKVYNEFREELTTLEEQEKAAEFDYESPTGNAAARSHIHALRRVKGRVEAARKAEKQASLDYGRKVDAEAKAIKDAIDQMIVVHQAPLDEIEARENARQKRHEDAIQRMLEMSTPTNEEVSAHELARRLDQIRSIVIGPEWEEYMAEATKVHTQALDNLGQWLERQEKTEADRAELEERRRAEAEEARKKRDADIAEQAARRARQEAEDQARKEREESARREQEAVERAEKAEREAAERERRAREEERRRADRLEFEREQREEQQREAEQRRRADQEHRERVHAEIATALERADLSEQQIALLLNALISDMIPHVTINY